MVDVTKIEIESETHLFLHHVEVAVRSIGFNQLLGPILATISTYISRRFNCLPYFTCRFYCKHYLSRNRSWSRLGVDSRTVHELSLSSRLHCRPHTSLVQTTPNRHTKPRRESNTFRETTTTLEYSTLTSALGNWTFLDQDYLIYKGKAGDLSVFA